MKATILEKYPCIIFNYQLEENIQGKLGEENGIFFDIREIQIICFNTGICFLAIKTTLDGENQFSDVLNFNYKFRDISSPFNNLKEYENIRIQTESFNNMQTFSAFLKEICGSNKSAKELNMQIDRFITYSYTCLDQAAWNENADFSVLERQFYQYANLLPESKNVDYCIQKEGKKFLSLEEWKYIKYGFSNLATVLLTCDIATENYTKLPFCYENEYFYSYLLMWYKKIYLKKINLDYEKCKNKRKTRKEFIDFTQSFWIQELTNHNIGVLLNEKWEQQLGLNTLYQQVKNQYDICYKQSNIEKIVRNNKIIFIILLIALIFNLLNFGYLFGRG